MAQQKSTQEFWIDEAGMKIPYARTTKVERLMEKESSRLTREAKKLNSSLTAYKRSIQKTCDRIYAEFMKSKENNKPGKGNFIWYNFDRTIKIEVSVSDRIEFDDLTIQACKDKFDTFIDDNVEGKADFVKELVSEAFSTSRGRLDSKKVMGLLKYRGKIKNALFQEALSLLEESIRRPDSKVYFRVWEKDSAGQYKNIDLNFSSIEL